MGNYLFCNHYLSSFEAHCIWHQTTEIESPSSNWTSVYQFHIINYKYSKNYGFFSSSQNVFFFNSFQTVYILSYPVRHYKVVLDKEIYQRCGKNLQEVTILHMRNVVPALNYIC